MSNERIEANVVVEYGFATEEPTLFEKIVHLWWIIPKSRILKAFLVTDQGIHIEMWDGRNYFLESGKFEAKYSCRMLPTIDIQTADGQTFKVCELVSMYTKGGADFDMVLKYLGVRNTTWNSINTWRYDMHESLAI